MRVRRPLLGLALLSILLAAPLPDPAHADPAITDDAHPSITIDGDLAFGDLFTGVRSGTGTAADPFVISDWHIVPTMGWAVRLIDTRAHAVIRDIFVHGATAAATGPVSCFPPLLGCPGSSTIWLDGAQNVTIERVHLVTGNKGLRIDDAKHIRVDDVRIGPGVYRAGLFEYGVYMYRIENITLSRLDVSSTRWPIAFGQGADITIRDSTIRGGEIGFGFGDFTKGLVLRNNTLSGTTVWAFGTMTDTLVVNNRFHGGSVSLGGAYPGTRFDRLHVCGNAFTEQDHMALDIRRGSDIRIEGNMFAYASTAAVQVKAAVAGPLVFDDNSVTHSTYWGVDLRVTGQTLRDNHFQDNQYGHIIAAPASDALYNWWGHYSGPSGIGSGSGDPLEDLGTGTAYSPWLTEPPVRDVTCP